MTRTLPAKPPDGWWTRHTRYRNYVLFSATSIALILVAIVILAGVWALSQGVEAWTAYLRAMASALGLLVTAFLFVGTLFFSLRWLRVGVKVAQVGIGGLPAPGAALLYIAHFGGLVAATVVLLVLLSGVIS